MARLIIMESVDEQWLLFPLAEAEREYLSFVDGQLREGRCQASFEGVRLDDAH